MAERKIRVLIAKPGLDGHDRGAKVIARALRDAGMEVIYTGLRQTVDAIGLSILSGAHMHYFTEVLEKLKARNAQDILLFGGGIVPNEDIAKLKEMGVAELFTPGASTQAVVEYLEKTVPPRREAVV
jgi:methylmalonyl-CoA mutase, C-terminal domain